MEPNFQSSLTAPNDKDSSIRYAGARNAPSLVGEEARNAQAELSNDNFIRKFSRVERVFCDPPIPGQMYGLVSFIPSREAKPDPDGVYGMIKLRGNYQTLDEMNERADFLVNSVDSYHTIFHAYVGRPFPATESSKYSADTNEVDIRQKVTRVISQDIKQKRSEEKREIEDMKQREKELIEDAEKEDEDPYERYITLRVKKAQLTWTYLETQKKMDQMKESIIKTRTEIAESDASNPEYIDSYREKYMDARTKAGIKDEDESFIKFLGEDADLGF